MTAEPSGRVPGGPRLIVIVGPTAAGKTAAAVELAGRIGGEIVSADSMQVYRHMDVGTAKPGTEERRRTPFHLLDIADPDRQISVADWKELAQRAIADIRSRGNAPIVCGGTGLYVRALLDNWSLAGTPADPVLRERLRERLESEGSAALHAELATVDPAAAARLHPNDAVRIVRALEVHAATGSPISELQRRDRASSQRVAAVQIGLTLPRAELYFRIERRVDEMLEQGLESEVRRLLERGYSPQHGPMRSLGYKEMVQYVMGELSHSEMASATKQSTRRYAKRQMTWFRADPGIVWIDAAANNSATVASRIEAVLETVP